MAEYDRLARAEPELEGQQKAVRGIDASAKDGGAGDLAREAISRVSGVTETLSFALEWIAAGKPLGSTGYVRQLVMADALMRELIRLIPEAEFTAALREICGREAMPVRLR
ncbi:MAG: hypothetical protein E5W94_02305 [Mesorhizobium sp.]|nr:MAG: hypothetical protein EOS34_22945 [Mesorhizobium sp.]TIS80171.1 MAG: hypothetical protein E5W94_02305 [Mesorhizobium sp.]